MTTNQSLDLITFPQLAQAIWNHRFKAGIIFLLVFSVIVFVFLIYPRKYGSEGRVFVQLGRGSIGLDPTATTSSGSINLNESRETEIKSMFEIVNSLEVAEMVVDEVGVERILEKKMDLPDPSVITGFLRELVGNTDDVDSDGMSTAEYEQRLRREKAVQKVMVGSKVRAEKSTTIISITNKSDSPTLARDIVDSYMRNFQKKHLEVNRNERSSSFFEEYYHQKEQELKTAQKALADYFIKHGIQSIEGAQEILQTKSNNLQLELQLIETSIAASEAKIAAQEDQLSNMKQDIQIRKIKGRRGSTELMLDRISELLIEKTNLSGKLPEDHPKLIAIESSLSEAKKIYESMPQDDDDVFTEVNPNLLVIEAAKLDEQSSLRGSQKKLSSVKSKLTENVNEIAKLNAMATEVFQLKRDIDSRESTFNIYAARRAEAEVISKLDTEQISSIKTWQKAKLILKPVSPSGMIVLPIGFMFSLFCALLFVLWSESRQTVPTSAATIEQQLEVPVLMSIPRVPPSQTILN